MKRILITGANSYIGTSVEKWLMKEPHKYYISTLDMKNPNWKNFDFSSYDVVFHVAGIAHVSRKKNMEGLYYKVNRDLSIEVAQTAKKADIKQFIFMSSMIVYNSKESKITIKTQPNPDNFYGRSKLEAEESILKLSDKKFKVVIIRAPMIYGPNSRGNFPKLYNLSLKTFIFPKYINKRSILYIDNLSEFIHQVIKHNSNGIFFPQNREIISTSDIVKVVNKINNRKILMTPLFNILFRFLSKKISIFNKLFSDLFFDSNISKYDFEYQIVSFNESIHILEMNNE